MSLRLSFFFFAAILAIAFLVSTADVASATLTLNSSYQIVHSPAPGRCERQAANLLRQALATKGVKVRIIADQPELPAAEQEIVLGQTSRETLAGLEFDRDTIGNHGFFLRVVGQRLFIAGGNDYGTKEGVKYFLQNYLTKSAASAAPEASSEARLPISANLQHQERQRFAVNNFIIAGKPLVDFVVIADSQRLDDASRLVELAFAYTGIRLKIVPSATPPQPSISFSPEMPEQPGSFEWCVKEGNVLLKSDQPLGWQRGLQAFFAKEVCQRQEKDYLMTENQVYRHSLQPVVYYSEFGARGDGVQDDSEAIRQAHEFANLHDLPVKADNQANYYLSGNENTAVIKTDTDFGNAQFLIDDTNLERRQAPIFLVESKLQAYKLPEVTSIGRQQTNLGITLPQRSMLCATDNSIKRYIRYGSNQNNGASQTDVFIVEKDGTIDQSAPLLWDFKQISDLTVYPIDEKPLLISGGVFLTKANEHASEYAYHSRNIQIRRSNVLIDGLRHEVFNEGDHGAPYSGFLTVGRCADVVIRNTVLTGHKTYRTIGSAGRPVSMGTYDLGANRAINISYINCTQTNDINDRTYWGIMGSNYCKNLLYDNCVLSRFDAHQGVANATIRNSTIGSAGVSIIGIGTFLVENSTLYGQNLVSLRADYGSTWQGEFIIRNCTYIPAGGNKASACIVGGSNLEQHDFGYTCYMPEKITIDGLHIEDSNHPDNYAGPVIFAVFNRNNSDDSYQGKFPHLVTKKVFVNNITTASGLPLRVSSNTHMFRNVKVLPLGQ